jgi:hypothetical protein
MKNTKLTVNIIELVSKEWTVEEVDNNLFKVYYVNKGRGNSPKPFILPKIIEINSKFMEAVGMYLGDGKLSADDKHLGFSSIDMDMSRFILDFFITTFKISLKDMTISIRFKEFKKKKLANWSKALDVPISKLKVQLTQRTRNESCEMQISGKVFRIIFENILNTIRKSDFLENQELRRAFLRGIFAAEGNIAINSKENYIVCIQFCLCYHELKLLELIQKALRLENVTSKIIKRQKDTSLTIQITNWNNYYKLWKMDLFIRNLRKEFQFLNKLKITRFSCKINKNMKEKLFTNQYFSDRQLGYLIGAYPTLFHKTRYNKNEFIKVEFLINLAKISSISLEEVKSNLIEFRVNDITPINDKEFIDFIFNLKHFI